MNVIPPLTITDAILTSSSVIETAPTAYNGATNYAVATQVSVAGTAGELLCYQSLAGTNLGNTPATSPTWWKYIGLTYQVYSGATTYALGDMVIDATNHIVYESLSAGNVGQALTNTLKWLNVCRTNRWALFNTLKNTATIVPSPLTMTLTPSSRIDAIAMTGLVATQATIVMTDNEATVYSSVVDLNTRLVSGWYGYFFNPFRNKTAMALFDLPPISSAIITITIENSRGSVECRSCSIGRFQNIGEVQYSAESDVLNFSTVTRDFAGSTASIVQRRNVQKTIQNIMVDKSKVNAIRALRDDLAATPAVWVGLDDNSSDYFESLLILGFYKRFSINCQYPEVATISLELEEV
jgi:hypothetical protein